MDNKTSFVKDIEPNIYVSPNESAFEKLFKEYEQVIVRSIVTSFGLDMFIEDQHGGDVDTIHNVRQIGKDPKMVYKNAANEKNYNEREAYDNVAYHKDERYASRVSAARSKFNETGEMIDDAYVEGNKLIPRRNDTIPRGQQAQLDHVKSAYEINEDRGRVLSGLDGKELANCDDNLRFTNAALNNNMRDKSVEEYIKWCEENHDKVNYNGKKGEPLPEEVKQKLREEYARADAIYNEKLNKAYYLDFSNPNCRQFYKDTASAAAKRGLEMGLRQALGFLLVDLWFSIKEEVKASDRTAKGCIDGIIKGLETGLNNAKNNYKEIIGKFGEGFISGILASLTTTLINIFFTTGQNLGRIIRQAWSSITEAVSVIFFGSEEYFCDRITTSAKIIASGASVIMGTVVQEDVSVKLAEAPIPDKLKDVISGLAGSLCTGLLSVTLLFYIDNDPFCKFLEGVYGQNLAILQEQARLFQKYCAELENFDVDKMQYEAKCIRKLLSEIEGTDDNNAINDALNKTRKELGIPSLWEGTTLDAKMNDKNWVLTF